MTDKTTEIEVIAAPADYDKTNYQFFRNKSTGRVWKASSVLQQAFSPMINGDIEAAPTQLAVQITVSPVDDNGKALRENDKPIIMDVHSHTFTTVEMSEPDFDPINRMLAIVAERIHVGEARLEGINKLNEINDAWNKKAKLKVSGTFKYVEPERPIIVDETPTIITPTGDAVKATQPLVGFTDGQTTTAPMPQKSAASDTPPASETDAR